MHFWRKLRGTVDCASCVNPYGLIVHRDQAEREAKYGKQCMPRTGYAELILTHILISAQSHGRSVTALAGEKKINVFSR